MNLILVEANRVTDFIRPRMNMRRKVEPAHLGHQAAVKSSNALRLQFEATRAAVVCLNHQPMIDEVKVDLKHARAKCNRRRRQTARRHVQRDVP